MATGVLQRKCACGRHTGSGQCHECKKKHGMLQRYPASASSAAAVPAIVHEVLRSPGQPLDKGTRDFMGTKFGHDFSQVRVHTDEKASESARSVDAVAYTVGEHVVFDRRLRPTGSADLGLIAHELAHVVQQRNVSPSQPLKIDVNGEAEAESAAKNVTAGAAPQLSRRSGLSRQAQTYAQTRQSVLDELRRPMPVAIYGLLDSSDAETRRQLRYDPEINAALEKLPARVRLTIGRHIWFGSAAPKELMDLESAAERHDAGKVRQGLAALKQRRESSLGSIETGNIKEKLDLEFSGTPAAAAIHREAESALEFTWDEMHAMAMQSPKFRALEARVLRRNPGLAPGKGSETESNVPSNFLSVERNVSLKGAIVRYAHELANFSLADDFDRVRSDAQGGKYATPHDCAMARINVELEANITREEIAHELNFEYDTTLASGLNQVRQAPDAAKRQQASAPVYQDLHKRYTDPTTAHGRKVVPLYEKICAGWMPQKQNP